MAYTACLTLDSNRQDQPCRAKGIRSSAEWGQSVLQNIFDQHPYQPNFIGISLSRSEDREDTADGSITIGEYDDDYAAIVSAPRLLQYPPNGGRWSTLLNDIIVNGQSVLMGSRLKGVPQGRIVVLLDTGTPYATLPVHIADL